MWINTDFKLSWFICALIYLYWFRKSTKATHFSILTFSISHKMANVFNITYLSYLVTASYFLWQRHILTSKSKRKYLLYHNLRISYFAFILKMTLHYILGMSGGFSYYINIILFVATAFAEWVQYETWSKNALINLIKFHNV